MEAKGSSEMSMCIYHTMLHQIQDDSNLHKHCHEHVAPTEKN